MDWLRRARADSDTTASSDPSLDGSSGGTTLSDDCSRWVHRYPCLTPEKCDSRQDVYRESPADCPRHDSLGDCAGADMSDDVVWIDELECRGSHSDKDPVLPDEKDLPGTASDLSTSVGRPRNTTRESNSDCGESGQSEDDSGSSSGSEDIVVYDPKRRCLAAAQRIPKPTGRLLAFMRDVRFLTNDLDGKSVGDVDWDEEIEGAHNPELAYSDDEVSSRGRSMSFSTNATFGEDNPTNANSLISTNPRLHSELIRKESILKRLPPPIRHRILTLLLKTPFPITPWELHKLPIAHRIHPANLQACSQFYNEGTPILYEQNTFRFETADSLFHWLVPSSTRFPPTSLSTHTHHQIRHLELTADTFAWFTTNLASDTPYPQLDLSKTSSHYDDEGHPMTTIWDLRPIETLTVDFWVTGGSGMGFSPPLDRLPVCSF